MTPLPGLRIWRSSKDAPTPAALVAVSADLVIARHGGRAADDARRRVERQPGRQRPAAVASSANAAAAAAGGAGRDVKAKGWLTKPTAAAALVMAGGRGRAVT